MYQLFISFFGEDKTELGIFPHLRTLSILTSGLSILTSGPSLSSPPDSPSSPPAPLQNGEGRNMREGNCPFVGRCPTDRIRYSPKP
jgi:hypothetical protein